MTAEKKWTAWMLGIALFSLALWISVCLGYYLSVRTHTEDLATAYFSDAHLDAFLLKTLRSGDIEKAKDVVRQDGQLRIFTYDQLRASSDEGSFAAFVIHPRAIYDLVTYKPPGI